MDVSYISFKLLVFLELSLPKYLEYDGLVLPFVLGVPISGVAWGETWEFVDRGVTWVIPCVPFDNSIGCIASPTSCVVPC